jgi:hypothetical protein
MTALCPPVGISIARQPAAPGNSVIVDNGKILYTAGAQPGFDKITYSLACNAYTSTAYIYIYIADKPDNIFDDVCYVDAPAPIWDIEQKAASNNTIDPLATPYAGDLDNDGHVEIVVLNDEGYGVPGVGNKIRIFDDELNLKHSIDPRGFINMPNKGIASMLIADVDNTGDYLSEIVVAGTDMQLRCYAHNGTEASPKWTTTERYTPITNPTNPINPSESNDSPSLIIADIDGDGKAELLTMDKIYAAESGHLLATLPAGGRGHAPGTNGIAMPVFADVDNDGIQEIVAGNTVYKVTINDCNDTIFNTAVIMATAPGNRSDGFTSVADIDLDVIVTVSSDHFYVWNGATSALIGEEVGTDVANPVSRASAGNINGNKRPDIAFTYKDRIKAYQYNAATNKFVQMWEIITSSDEAAAISMFDFNQDGETELVYQDQTDLRIIGKNGANLVSVPLPSTSYTSTGYPIVVDIDRDGHADIITMAALNDDDIQFVHTL